MRRKGINRTSGAGLAEAPRSLLFQSSPFIMVVSEKMDTRIYRTWQQKYNTQQPINTRGLPRSSRLSVSGPYLQAKGASLGHNSTSTGPKVVWRTNLPLVGGSK
jgi:hypothetical protein